MISSRTDIPDSRARPHRDAIAVTEVVDDVRYLMVLEPDDRGYCRRITVTQFSRERGASPTGGRAIRFSDRFISGMSSQEPDPSSMHQTRTEDAVTALARRLHDFHHEHGDAALAGVARLLLDYMDDCESERQRPCGGTRPDRTKPGKPKGNAPEKAGA